MHKKNRDILIKLMIEIVGKNNVLFDDDSICVYSVDSTNIVNPDEKADVIVFPLETNHVSKIMKYFVFDHERKNTVYHEFQKGRFDGHTFWKSDSISISDDLLVDCK